MPEQVVTMPHDLLGTIEGQRIAHAGTDHDWRRWGPYLSERQWGTVREDYSPGGTAWDYFPHDHARSRAYRWGEDSIGGFGDSQLNWCLGVALWNGNDPILKERMFGLTNSEGNHGEDVKELYYYTDGVPSHAYMRMLYKYPQAAFPYQTLIEENRKRGRHETEFELLDTGIFDEQRYFDVTIEYAKAGADDILMRITAVNRGPIAAPLHLLGQCWARNTWSWRPDAPRPSLRLIDADLIEAIHPAMPLMHLHVEPGTTMLFCENDSNPQLHGGAATGPFKDGINDFVVHGAATAVSTAQSGTKTAAMIVRAVDSGGTLQLRLRLCAAGATTTPFADFDAVFATRQAEADAFYDVLQRDIADSDARLVQRQALAGMLWSKQFYHIDIPEWLAGDPISPRVDEGRKHGRNADWAHLNNADIISMPDTWEFPWYAAWDLAFHCVTFALIDPEFAKGQLLLLTREWYMHPNGQLPAYEWAFGDVNPPVHAWAAWRVFQMDRVLTGKADLGFLERIFHKLLLNFTWWVNRKDATGRNIFQGGFLGLDNIGLFDRSAPLPTGGTINQADGTAWMAMYSLNLLRISLELAMTNPVYEDTATKFFEHFLYIADAMTRMGSEDGLWDEADGFFYDVLDLPGKPPFPLRVRSVVGLIPLFAVEVIEPSFFTELPEFTRRLRWFLNYRPDLARLVSRWHEPAQGERHLLSLLRGHRMKKLLRRMLDETEFLSSNGVRAVSKIHATNPCVFEHAGNVFSVTYEPGESTSGIFGGNSNWRGPVWMPVNYLFVESLRKFHLYYGPDFKIECPAGSGTMLDLHAVADELAHRLCSLFLRGSDGRRPVLGTNTLAQTDPAFRDNILFHEYFDGDTGRGLGASHQTGWTGIVALLLQPIRAPAS